MNKLVIAFALTALVASPALAQSKKQKQAAAKPRATAEAVAPAPANGPYAAYIGDGYGGVNHNGTVNGSDPDPNIRGFLLRGDQAAEWND
jgi:hypothetical protein